MLAVVCEAITISPPSTVGRSVLATLTVPRFLVVFPTNRIPFVVRVVPAAKETSPPVNLMVLAVCPPPTVVAVKETSVDEPEPEKLV